MDGSFSPQNPEEHRHVQTDKIVISALQPTIGAEIRNIDLSSGLSNHQIELIREALLKFKVIFFHDQRITQRQYIDFAQLFGPIYRPPGMPPVESSGAIHAVTAEYYRPAGAQTTEAETLPQLGRGYHTDGSWRLVPPWASILRSVTLPDVGGDTVWVDCNLAYTTLPSEIRDKLTERHVTHDMRFTLYGDDRDYPIVSHPLVRRHRETGQICLWVNFSARPHIIGLDRDENNTLLRIVAEQYARPEFQVRFSWKPHSIAFWDNRAVVHYAVRNYGDFPRKMERILLAESEPLYAHL